MTLHYKKGFSFYYHMHFQGFACACVIHQYVPGFGTPVLFISYRNNYFLEMIPVTYWVCIYNTGLHLKKPQRKLIREYCTHFTGLRCF